MSRLSHTWENSINQIQESLVFHCRRRCRLRHKRLGRRMHELVVINLNSSENLLEYWEYCCTILDPVCHRSDGIRFGLDFDIGKSC